MSEDAYVVVGLGNPGATYAKTRHNAGFMLVDKLHEAYGGGGWTAKFNGSLARVSIGGQDVLLFKPQAFMNRSGPPVIQLVNYFKIPLNHVIVVYDDLDLPVGSFKLRLRQDSLGGSGGHNGINSLLQAIGSPPPSSSFLRLRLGIDHPHEMGLFGTVSDYVLGRFTEEQAKIVGDLQERMVRHFPTLLGADKNLFTQYVKESQ